MRVVLMKRGNFDTWAHKKREDHLKIPREDSHMARLMHLPAKEHRGLLENTISLRRQGWVMPEPSKKAKPHRHADFRFGASRTVGQCISVLSHSVFATLLWHP